MATSLFLQLLPVKLIYMFLFGGFSCVVPFFPVYFSSLGLSGPEIGVLVALMPFCSLIASPVIGFISDWSSSHRLILICLVTFYLFNRLFFLFAFMDTFWPIFLTMIIGEFAGGAVAPIVDSICLMILGKENSQLYGRQRLWGAIGWGGIAPLAGLVAKMSMKYNFFLHTGMMVATIVSILFLKVVPPKREVSMMEGIKAVLNSGVLVAVFFVAVFLMGTAFGLVANFIFLYVKELGGDEFLMGITLTVTCAAEIPMFQIADKILSKFGCEKVIAFAMVCMIVRMAYYSVVYSAIAIVPIELLHGITFGLMYAAGTEYTSRIAPKGLSATLQGMFSGIFYGLGGGIGTVTGGVMYESVGLRTTFRIQCIVVLVALLLFLWSMYMKAKESKKQSNYSDIEKVTADIELELQQQQQKPEQEQEQELEHNIEDEHQKLNPINVEEQ